MTTGVPVAVALDLPRLELDRPFTYRWPDDAPVTGAYVSVVFHGRSVKGWVLGPTDDVPPRVLPIRRVLSRVSLFDERDLAAYRLLAERCVAPLATVIDRAHPPRVASEETIIPAPPTRRASSSEARALPSYTAGGALLDACHAGGGAFLVRPLPEDEATLCLEAVGACLAGGRRAIVVVPEADPLPATARAVAEAFATDTLVHVGGSPRDRYRGWVEAAAGHHRVVVGTRGAVFAPLRDLGLLWVNREAHPGHREERAPYHHARDAALARARAWDAVAVLAGHAPGGEAIAAARRGDLRVVRASRQRERAAAPLVEVVRPDRDDVTPRLERRLREGDGAFLLVSRAGYGVARVCRDCGTPARCGVCGGAIAVARGEARCGVCGSEGVCTSCGSRRFGIDPGGVEHVERRASRIAARPVVRVEAADEVVAPAPGRVVVGTAAAVKDLGPVRVPLVGILDADRARRRPGLAAPGQVLATWMEAAVWAGPKAGGGRVVVQTAEPGDAIVQALVRWDPWHLHAHEAARRAEAGFPPGHPIFRLRGTPDLPAALGDIDPPPVSVLSTPVGDETVSLVTIRPDAVGAFRAWVMEHLGVVTRVEANPDI